LSADGAELYRWDGYLPPTEYAARALTGFAQAYLRTRNYSKADRLYVEVLRRFPTSVAAAEANYYLGVTRYRADPDSNEMLHQWSILRSKYPQSEYRIKQSFKELPE
jgi:TolA-binding protein